MDIELKHIISRGFTRKVNLGNYESADFFSNHSQELIDPTPEEILVTSVELSMSARQDVEKSIKGYFDEQKSDLERAKELLPKMIENASTGTPSNIEDYNLVVETMPDAIGQINEAKKAYNRSQYKSKKQNNADKNNQEDTK